MRWRRGRTQKKTGVKYLGVGYKKGIKVRSQRCLEVGEIGKNFATLHGILQLGAITERTGTGGIGLIRRLEAQKQLSLVCRRACARTRAGLRACLRACVRVRVGGLL